MQKDFLPILFSTNDVEKNSGLRSLYVRYSHLTPVKDARKPLIFIFIITPFGRTLSDVAAVESFPLKYIHLLYVGKPLLTA
jgi:hypothetical protein